jgi:hypothetical protein
MITTLATSQNWKKNKPWKGAMFVLGILLCNSSCTHPSEDVEKSRIISKKEIKDVAKSGYKPDMMSKSLINLLY